MRVHARAVAAAVRAAAASCPGLVAGAPRGIRQGALGPRLSQLPLLHHIPSGLGEEAGGGAGSGLSFLI